MASKFALLAMVWAVAAQAEPLVGKGVGDADALVSEATKLYNKKQYAKAADLFTRATRANPAPLSPYLQLGRSLLAAKQVQRACYVYRVYLKAAPETPERKKAQAESEQCERQLKVAKNQPPDMGPKYVDSKATFYAALEKGELVGANSASESLQSLVRDGFVGPELGEMANKLADAAAAQADAIHNDAMKEKVATERLRQAQPLYKVVQDLGRVPDGGRSDFLEGLAALQDKEYRKAETAFSAAAKASPSNKEYHFYRGLALFQAGDKVGALKVLDENLKADPRTEVLRVSLAVSQSSENGAAELEKLLFNARYTFDK
ncbi:MAG: tetratricopeptide repeat protein [Myxococcaceae bacterium]|nr:tetratricopeptide repeat protein [Myxococcaceae bacterium]